MNLSSGFLARIIPSWIRETACQSLELLLPVQCTLCAARDFSPVSGQSVYCPRCVETLCPVPGHRCLRCGAEVGPYSDTNNGCVHCRNRNLKLETVISLGTYDGELRRAVLRAKWSHSAAAMRSLGCLLATARIEQLRSAAVDRVIPIPHHWTQRVMRQFSSAWIIASEIAASLGIPCDAHLLKRQRRTRLQKRVHVSRRFENQKNSFGVRDPHVLSNQRILLVDDVLTTGATCSEAAAVLHRAGAGACVAAVLARVLDSSA